MISCKDISALVSASLDRRLSTWERAKIRLHLVICKGCTNFSRQMEILRAATRHLAEGGEMTNASRPRLSEQARTRIQRAMQETEDRTGDPDD